MAYFAKQILAKWTNGEWINDRVNSPIEGFSIDSRKIDSNQMFVALKTDKRDGHHFVGDAEKRGAMAALTEQYIGNSRIPQLKVNEGVNALQTIAFKHRETFSGSIVGITGSCGKTSTKDLLSILLGEKRVLKTAGNLNNHLGVPLTLLRLDSGKHDFGVVEAGINSRGEMSDLADMINADWGIVTMIGRAHLELLKDLDTIAREKVNLLKIGKQKQGVVYPASCLQYRSFQTITHTSNYVLTPISMRMPEVDWIKPIRYWCENDEWNQWVLFLKGSNDIIRSFRVPNLSPGMRQNLALALYVAGELGVSDALLQQRLNHWCPSENRGEVFQTEKGWIYSDCYNANPDSMRDSLKAFNASFDAKLPRLFVLGSMYELGQFASQYHQKVGEDLRVRPGDEVVCVGDFASDYATGLIKNGVEQEQIVELSDVSEAVEKVGHFEGAVFLKGSRMNRLETLIPNNAQKVVLEAGNLC